MIDNSRQCGYGYDQRVEAFGSPGIAASENPAVHSAVRRDRGGFRGPAIFESSSTATTPASCGQWKAFVDAVATGGVSPVSGRDARAPLVIGIAANESLRTGVPVAVGRVTLSAGDRAR